MTSITQSNSGSEAIGIINANLDELGSETAIGNDSGSAVCSALNTEFGDYDDVTELTAAMSGEDFVDAVNDNFENAVPKEHLGKMRFLHISDPHGYSDALGICKDMADEDDGINGVIVSGDISQYTSNVVTEGIDGYLDTLGTDGKLLITAGNHDAYDLFGSSHQQQMTALLNGWLGSNVVWGRSNDGGLTPNVASYWHRDYPIGETHKLRVISLDQYELAFRKPGTYRYTVYTQAQVDWLIGLLKGLGKDDYLIILMHEPAIQNQSGLLQEDTYAKALSTINGNQQKLFVTSRLKSFENLGDEPSLNLLPRIIKAYMHGEVCQFDYTNKGGDTSNPDITIDEDFSLVEPATFLCYISGHTHSDIGYYIPDESNAARDGGDFSDQLMFCVTAASRSVSNSNSDDLGGADSYAYPSNPSTETYRINEYEFDFDAKTIKVTRHGDKNTYSGRVRDSITFPFVKEGGEE